MSFAELKSDMNRFDIELDSSRQWTKIQRHLCEVSFLSDKSMLDQFNIPDSWIFISDGIAASQQVWEDGRVTIARFFEQGDFCTNFTSAWTRDIEQDNLFAVTKVSGVAIPDALIREEFFQGGSFGIYLRHKMIESHLFAKELVCIKTSLETEVRYQFLRQQHKNVLGRTQKKYIAQFLGITPQALSRFLRRSST